MSQAEKLSSNGPVRSDASPNTALGVWLAPFGVFAAVLIGLLVASAFGQRAEPTYRSATPAPKTISTISQPLLNAMASSLEAIVPARDGGEVQTVGLGSDGLDPVASVGEMKSAYVVTSAGENHTWRFFVSARGADKDVVAGCPNEASSPTYSCSARETEDGLETTTRLVALRFPSAGADAFTFASPKDLTDENLPNLRVEQVVRLYFPDGGYLSAREEVVGPPSLDFDKAFSSADGLSSLVHDPDIFAAVISAG